MLQLVLNDRVLNADNPADHVELLRDSDFPWLIVENDDDYSPELVAQ